MKDPKLHLENIKISDEASEWVTNKHDIEDERNPHSFLVNIPRGEHITNLSVCQYICKSTALFLPMVSVILSIPFRFIHSLLFIDSAN